MAGNCLND